MSMHTHAHCHPRNHSNLSEINNKAMGNYRLFSFWTLWTSAWLLLLQWSGEGTISSQFHFSIKDTTWTTAFISLHLCQSFTLVQIKSQTLLSNTEGKHCTQGIAVNRSCNPSEKLFIRLTAEVLLAAFPQEGGYAGLGTVYSGWTHDSHEGGMLVGGPGPPVDLADSQAQKKQWELKEWPWRTGASQGSWKTGLQFPLLGYFACNAVLVHVKHILFTCLYKMHTLPNGQSALVMGLLTEGICLKLRGVNCCSLSSRLSFWLEVNPQNRHLWVYTDNRASAPSTLSG